MEQNNWYCESCICKDGEKTKIIVHKERNYVCMSTYHLQDKNMTLAAKGLLSLMLSLGTNSNFSVEYLSSISGESEITIKNLLKELQKLGYLIIGKVPSYIKYSIGCRDIYNPTGEYEDVYHIYEKPFYKIFISTDSLKEE